MIFEIISGLWIGDYNSLFDNNFLNDNNINIVINCTKNVFCNRDFFKKIRIPLENTQLLDKNIKIIKEIQNNFCKLIKENLDNYNIFICCYNGLNFSPLLISLYLIKEGNINYKKINEIINQKNEKINIDINILELILS